MNCNFCKKECVAGRSHTAHEAQCKENPNRRIAAKRWSDESKQKLAISSNRRASLRLATLAAKPIEELEKSYSKMREVQKNRWTDELRLEKSKRMKLAVEENPDSYSKNNVSGRVKRYKTTSVDGECTVTGRWELKVADWLNENGVRWTNSIQPYPYKWNQSWHMYFPDFHLIDLDVIIEVKGYKRDRDSCKWAAVTDKTFIIIEKKDIENLDSVLTKLLRVGEQVDTAAS